jgi:hypothetical protein
MMKMGSIIIKTSKFLKIYFKKIITVRFFCRIEPTLEKMIRLEQFIANQKKFSADLSRNLNQL